MVFAAHIPRSKACLFRSFFYIFRHHINAWFMKARADYREQKPNDIVVDYLASMTDEYLIDLFNKLFPDDAVPLETLYVPHFK